jgi:nicotinate-nucleotide adenylyltransferase
LTTAAARRVGLFGGSFDPVHNAHLALANAALQSLQLHELRWIPTGHAWQKTRTMTPAHHRVALVQAAIADEPRFVLSTVEVERHGPSYTLDTVRELMRAEQKAARGSAVSPTHGPKYSPNDGQNHTMWFLTIGQDQYCNLHTWRHWQELLGLVTLAVANRPGDQRQPHPDVKALAHHVVPLPMLDISSTQVRQRAAAGQDITPLVPPAVARYIETHGLYRSPAVS